MEDPGLMEGMQSAGFSIIPSAWPDERGGKQGIPGTEKTILQSTQDRRQSLTGWAGKEDLRSGNLGCDPEHPIALYAV